MSNVNPAGGRSYGSWLIAAAGALAFVILLIDYLLPHGEIAQSWGALLVVVSTGLMWVAALLIAIRAIPRWLVILFDILILLDIFGTGFCAYFLETWIVIILMIVALIGWVAHLNSHSEPSGADQKWPASSKAR